MPQKSESISDVRKKITLTHDFISTNYHESGHTIYGLLHFMMIYSVSVFQNKKNKRVEGSTRNYSIDLEEIKNKRLLKERITSEIGLCYAGLVAEKHRYKLHSGSDHFPSCLDGSYEDRKEAAKLISKYNIAASGRARQSYKNKMMKKVSQELQQHWDAVTIVAHALFSRKYLSFSEIKKLLTTKTINKKFWKKRFKDISHYYAHEDTLGEKYFLSMISL